MFKVCANGNVIRNSHYIHSFDMDKGLENKIQYLKNQLEQKIRFSKSTAYRSQKIPLTANNNDKNILPSLSSFKTASISTEWSKKELQSRKHYHHVRAFQSGVHDGNKQLMITVIRHCARNCGVTASHLVNGRNANGVPYLITAIMQGRLDVVKLFIENCNANIHITGTPPSYFPAVVYAASTGYLDMIRYLLNKGAILTEKDVMRLKRLMGLTRKGKTLPNENNVRNFLIKHWRQKLLRATLLNDEESVLLVLALNASSKNLVNIRDSKRNTPMHIACLKGSQTIVEYLLRYDKKCGEVFDGDGMKPLQIALAHGQLTIADLLIQNGSKLNAIQLKDTLDLQKTLPKSASIEHLKKYALLCMYATQKSEKSAVIELLTKYLSKMNGNKASILQPLMENNQITPRKNMKNTKSLTKQLSLKCLNAKKEKLRALNKHSNQTKSASILVPFAKSPMAKKMKALKPIKRIKKSISMCELIASNILTIDTSATTLSKLNKATTKSQIFFSEKLNTIISEHCIHRKKKMIQRYTNKWKKAIKTPGVH